MIDASASFMSGVSLELSESLFTQMHNADTLNNLKFWWELNLAVGSKTAFKFSSLLQDRHYIFLIMPVRIVGKHFNSAVMKADRSWQYYENGHLRISTWFLHNYSTIKINGASLA